MHVRTASTLSRRPALGLLGVTPLAAGGMVAVAEAAEARPALADAPPGLPSASTGTPVRWGSPYRETRSPEADQPR